MKPEHVYRANSLLRLKHELELAVKVPEKSARTKDEPEFHNEFAFGHTNPWRHDPSVRLPWDLGHAVAEFLLMKIKMELMSLGVDA